MTRQVMVLFVMAFVILSVWAVIVDTLGPVIQHGSKAASTGCLLLAFIFLLQVRPLEMLVTSLLFNKGWHVSTATKDSIPDTMHQLV